MGGVREISFIYTYNSNYNFWRGSVVVGKPGHAKVFAIYPALRYGLNAGLGNPLPVLLVYGVGRVGLAPIGAADHRSTCSLP